MPTRTQSDTATVGHVPAALELETLWGDFDNDLFEDDLSREQSIPRTKPICRSIEFDAIRDSPGEARRRVVRALQGGGYDRAVIQDAALVVTELAANAVVHAKSSFSVSVRLRDSTLRIDVADGAAGRANQDWVPRQGRGLGLIDAICVHWGTEITAEGKVVWGELQL